MWLTVHDSPWQPECDCKSFMACLEMKIFLYVTLDNLKTNFITFYSCCLIYHLLKFATAWAEFYILIHSTFIFTIGKWTEVVYLLPRREDSGSVSEYLLINVQYLILFASPCLLQFRWWNIPKHLFNRNMLKLMRLWDL